MHSTIPHDAADLTETVVALVRRIEMLERGQDSLDRGVIDTGVTAGHALAKVGAIEAALRTAATRTIVTDGTRHSQGMSVSGSKGPSAQARYTQPCVRPSRLARPAAKYRARRSSVVRHAQVRANGAPAVADGGRISRRPQGPPW